MTGAIFARGGRRTIIQIGLAGRGAENFGAEASEVKARSGHGHHLDSAAGQAKAKRPYGALARPVYGLIEES